MSFAIDTVVVNSQYDVEQEVDGHTHGLDNIGQGLYGKVYSNGDLSHVVKVSAGDDGYFSWVKVIQQLGNGNRYLPKIHRVIQYRYPDGHELYSGYPTKKIGHTPYDKLVVYMEKLTTPKKMPDGLEWGAQQLWWKKDRNFSKFVSGIAQAACLAASKEGRYNWDTQKYEEMDWSKYSAHHIELITLLEIARQQVGCDWYDLHTGNVMMRGGQFVITDPLCAS